MARRSSGPSVSASAVDSTRSANITVTTRRSSDTPRCLDAGAGESFGGHGGGGNGVGRVEFGSWGFTTVLGGGLMGLFFGFQYIIVLAAARVFWSKPTHGVWMA